MKPTSAILLAGGRGTRLGTLTVATPKPLLDVAGRPFVFFLLDYLKAGGIGRIVISTGYLAEQFEEKIGKVYRGMHVDYVVEKEPLGTGGAIMRSLRTLEETAFVLNADTLFRISLSQMNDMHESMGADITIAVRQVPDLSRYGGVMMQGSRVVSFAEKGAPGPGLINGGIYLLGPGAFSNYTGESAFSFEEAFLPNVMFGRRVFGYEDPAYFIDMGVPEDLNRADRELGSA